MLFSSLTFIYIFLPLVLIAHTLLPFRYKNATLFFFSLIFYAWGNVSYLALLVFSIAANYFFGRLIGRFIDLEHKKKKALLYLFIGVALNVALLVFFKYTGFILHNINKFSDLAGFNALSIPEILLPLGISFFTFQGLSYLIDVYRGHSNVQKNFINLGLYISLFPQLIAGPIVRYHDIDNQLMKRKIGRRKFAVGIERFIIGLVKKVLLANSFALIVDKTFVVSPDAMSTSQVWMGIIFYSLQIYYDFAGYSDMAIGLGKMLGFDFLENFNFPYISRSVREFWRRWHISLSSWFRDYVYIPLGGSRKSGGRTYFNLILVFFLTGFWHGAGFSFIVWGLMHGFMMIVERLGFSKVLKKMPSVISNLYVVLFVMVTWVFFRAENLPYAIAYVKKMFIYSSDTTINLGLYYTSQLYFYLILGVLGAYGFFPLLYKGFLKIYKSVNSQFRKVLLCSYDSLHLIVIVVLLLFTTIILLTGSYNPFIYFRF